MRNKKESWKKIKKDWNRLRKEDAKDMVGNNDIFEINSNEDLEQERKEE